MSVVATFTVSAAQFPLTRVLPDDPDVGVRVERILNADGSVTPVFWVLGSPRQIETVATRLARLEGTCDVTRIDDVEGQALYRLTWRDGDGDLLLRFARDSLRLLCARGSADACELVVEFPDEDALERFETWADSHNLPVAGSTVQRIERDTLDFDTGPSEGSLFAALMNGLALDPATN